MPLKAINYDNTHFYRIVCRDLNIKDCYVGHTTDFTTRKNRHRKNCNNINGRDYNLKLYRFIRQNGGWENWDMILVKTLKCENVLEARAKERQFIEQMQASLNNNLPTRSMDEYYQENRVKILADKKEYAKNHKYEIREQRKNFRENNKEKIQQQKKDYHQKNRDEINEKKRQARQNNPEKFKERDKQAYQTKKIMRQRPCECECGVVCNFASRLAHFKTKNINNTYKTKITVTHKNR